MQRCTGTRHSAADALAGRLAAKGVKKIAVYDVSNTHVSELISEIFRASHVVFAAPTLQRRHLSGDGEPARRHEGTCGSEQDRSTDGERHLGTDDGKADERKTGGTEKCDDSGYADHHKSAMAPEQEGQFEALADAIVASMDKQ